MALLFLVELILFLPSIAQAESAHTKLSPRLQMLTSGRPDLVEIAEQRVHLKTAPEFNEPVVDALVVFQGDPKAIEAYGARVRSVLGNVATADIPVSALEATANHPDVVRIEEARKLRPRLDVSVPEAGANGVWGNSTYAPGTAGAKSRPLPPPLTGNTGRNVVVGVVDTGLDLKHSDFKDSFGKSRVLYVWDQTVNGVHPIGYPYGNECTKQQIDAGSCSEKDTDGHGTHVTGIAAGEGSATGGGKPAYRYIGMAPEANLIVVETTFYDSGIIDGIAYIQNKAAALSLPSVINLSLAGHDGPHDGTSNFETAMDAASGVGKVIVAAAGNEAEDDIHASGTVINNTAGPAVSFSVPGGSTDVFLDLWYPGADQMGVKVTNPVGTACPASGFRYPGSTSVTCGQTTITTPLTNVTNGDHEITIELRGGSVRTGTWTFTLTGGGCPSAPSCITDGTFDVWSDDASSNATFSNHTDPNKTVGMPATATKVIAVGAYTTKTSWTSSNGPGNDTFGTLGDITFFSSLGPRRSCSNAGNPICTAAVQKPELAAPGEEIMSSRAAGSAITGFCFDITSPTKCVDPDGQHVILQGTSMSSPHVAGAAALLLAKDRVLTSGQVKTAMENTRTDAFTGPTPNGTWGYGKLAVDLAAAAVGTNSPPSPTPAVPAGVSATAGGGSAKISWTGVSNDIFLDGYNVYESTTSGGPYTKANANIVSADSFNVTGLTAGTAYYFVVRSLDTPDYESGNSMEVTATPTTQSSSPGGGGCGMIDLTRGGPPNPFDAISYLLTLLLPIILIRIFRTRRARAFQTSSMYFKYESSRLPHPSSCR
jgi:subtilisin family serine protease